MALTEELEARLGAADAVIREIRDRCGKVCETYEICEHVACQSSYTAWAIADSYVELFPTPIWSKPDA